MARFTGLLFFTALVMQQQLLAAMVLRGNKLVHAAIRTPTQLTADMQKAVVEKHNQLRAARNKTHQPCSAADMEAMVWDEQLAADAQAYADGCVGDHPEGAGSKFGENIWVQFPDTKYTSQDLVNGVQSWQDEIVDTVWNIDDTKVTSKPLAQCADVSGDTCNVGHYFQVIWAKSNRIGCGVAQCTSGLSVSGAQYNAGVLMVCRYDKPASLGAGQTNSLPYMYGKPCAACPDHCSNGLCTAPPTRCLDKLGGDNEITIGAKTYTSCPELVKDYSSKSQMPWCTQLASMMDAEDTCALSCKKCEVPAGVGAQYCDGGNGEAAHQAGGGEQGVQEDTKIEESAATAKGGKEDHEGDGDKADAHGPSGGTKDAPSKGKIEDDVDEEPDTWGNWSTEEGEGHEDEHDEEWGNWTYADEEGDHEKGDHDNETAEDGWSDPWGDESDDHQHEEGDHEKGDHDNETAEEGWSDPWGDESDDHQHEEDEEYDEDDWGAWHAKRAPKKA